MQKKGLIIALLTVITGMGPAAVFPESVNAAPEEKKEKNSPGNSMTFTTIDNGSQSGIGERGLHVARTEAEWTALWKRHTSRTQPAPPTPKVDFNADMVIAVFAGTKKSGGYSLGISRIKEAGNKLMVDVVESSPRPGAMTTMALTQPFHIVKLQKSSLPVVSPGF